MNDGDFFLQTELSPIATMVIAIGTIILASVTAYYAHQTRRTADVMEKSTELSIMPHMKGHLITDGPVMAYFRISNVGNGTANNIVFRFWFESHPDEVKTWTNNLLMPKDHHDFLLIIPETKALADLDYFEKNQIKIVMKASYYDIQGKQYSIDETIDATMFAKDWIASNQKIHYEPLKEIADEIRDIKNIMQSEQSQKHFDKQFSTFVKPKKTTKKKSKRKKPRRK